MNSLDTLTMATGNLRRAKVRVALTMIAISIGSYALTLTAGLAGGVNTYLDKIVDSFGARDLIQIQSKNMPSFGPPGPGGGGFGRGGGRRGGPPASPESMMLTDADIEKIKAVRNMESVEPVRLINPDYIMGPNGEHANFNVLPFMRGAKLPLLAGKQLDNETKEFQVAIDETLAVKLGFADPKKAVGEQVTIGIKGPNDAVFDVKAKVQGVQEEMLFAALGSGVNDPLMFELFDMQNPQRSGRMEGQHFALLGRFSGGFGDTNVDRIKADLKDQGYRASMAIDAVSQVKSFVFAIMIVVDLFAAIALVAASFGIVNTLLMAVQERTKEIGLMKAMGMSSSRVFTLFGVEATMIGFGGCMLGLGSAYLMGKAANLAIPYLPRIKNVKGLDGFVFQPMHLVSITLIIMAIAFLAGVLPSLRAARLNPVDSLRYE